EVGAHVFQLAHEEFGDERGADGSPSEFDFVAWPLAVALLAFRDFDRLPYDTVPEVRLYTAVSPFFGPMTFAGLLRTDGVVEIVAYTHDPDYWRTIGSESDE